MSGHKLNGLFFRVHQQTYAGDIMRQKASHFGDSEFHSFQNVLSMDRRTCVPTTRFFFSIVSSANLVLSQSHICCPLDLPSVILRLFSYTSTIFFHVRNKCPEERKAIKDQHKSLVEVDSPSYSDSLFFRVLAHL